MSTSNSLLDLTGRHILVTGASSGIGRQCAIHCAELGASVSLFGRNTERLRATIDSMPNSNCHHAFPVDLTDEASTESAIDASLNKLGRFDGFIHSAGVQFTKPIKLTRRSDMHDLFTINVYVAFDLLRLVSAKKRRGKALSCVLIASVRAHRGESGVLAYSASKGALLSGARSAASELARYGVRVNTVSPGYIQTRMADEFSEELPAATLDKMKTEHPLGLGESQDVASACAFLLSDASRWITSSDFLVDGGFTLCG